MLSSFRLSIIWLFGLISGFNIMITDNTLNYWLSKENIALQTIGILLFITLPYSINFLFAPIFDSLQIKYLDKVFDHRLSWICLTSAALIFLIYILSFLNPHDNLLLFAVVSLIISFFSSTQDTILSAFRTEIIHKKSIGFTSGIYIFGYRIGMLLAGSGAIYLSIYLTFNEIYKIFAILIFVYLILLILGVKYCFFDQNKEIEQTTNDAGGIFYFISNHLKPIESSSFIILIIISLVLYRLPDNFINIMINPFLLHLGYNAFEIASVGKFCGVMGVMGVIGGLLGGDVMKKHDILNSMLFFGIIHALAHILFIILKVNNKSSLLLFITIRLKSITGGMAMTAYIAFISSLCQGKFRATQYSFFLSMMGISRSFFPVISGYIVVNFGWQNFFLFTTIITIPSLLIILKIKTRLQQ